ncbi:hypothetical protein QTN25_002049 [Entamoeba marina]
MYTKPPITMETKDKLPKQPMHTEETSKSDEKQKLLADPLSHIEKAKKEYRRNRFLNIQTKSDIDDEMKHLIKCWNNDIERMKRYVDDIGDIVLSVVKMYKPELYNKYIKYY